MPEHADARERLGVPCPKCRYPLVGLTPQRCPECGKSLGSVVMWAGYLRLTRAGKFIRQTTVRGFESRTLLPVQRGASVEFQKAEQRSPALLLASGVCCLIPLSGLVFFNAFVEFLVFASVVLGLLGIALLMIGFAKLIHKRRAAINTDRGIVTVIDQFLGLRIPRAAPLADAGLISHERPEISAFLGQRFFCTLFTTSTQLVLCTSKRREDVEAYVEALPEPMREMHISLLREEA